MYELERQTQHDPVLMDMLLGMELAMGDKVHQDIIDDIKTSITERTARPVKAMSRFSTWRKLGVAASILLVAGIGVLLIPRFTPDGDPSLSHHIESTDYPNLGVQESEPMRELAETDAESVAESELAEPARVQGAPSRTLAKRSAKVSKENLASITKPETNSILSAVDMVVNKQLMARTPMATRSEPTGSSPIKAETIILSSRSEPQSVEGKRLAMSIQSLPAGPVDSLYIRRLSGVVRAKGSGLPLSGVSIMGIDEHVYAYSGPDGKFNVVLPGKQETLTLTANGYQAQTVDVRDRNSFVVQLAPSSGSSNGAATFPTWDNYQRRDTSTNYPRPKEGWDAFERYLREHTTSSGGKGTVTLKFGVGNAGQLEHIQLEHTTNPALVKLATAILLAGPEWEQGANPHALAIIRIDFQ